MLYIQTNNFIEEDDWSNFVSEHYGKIYNFQQQEGCQDRGIYCFDVPHKYPEDFENDTIPEVVNGDEMGVSFKAWLERDIKQPLNSKDQWEREFGLDLFWERNFYPNVSMIINDLHEKGLLPAGEYVINIDW